MVAFALTRWPGLWPESFKNFSAAYALAFCAGVYFPGKLLWLPIATLLGTDVLLNVFYYHTDPISIYMAGNYLGYGLLIGLGRMQSSKSPWWKLVTGGLAGAVIFYVITNTVAWLQDDYPKTLAGWLTALTTGMPGWPPPWMFLRNSLLSGGLFTGLFAGAMKLSEMLEEAPEEEAEEEPEEAPEEVPQPEEAKV